MLHEREADQVEAEFLSLSPPRLRLRGPPRAVAEAVQALLEGAEPAEIVPLGSEAGEASGRGDPLPPFEAIVAWLRARQGRPYTVPELVAELTGQTPDEVKSRFYVQSKNAKNRRIVGSDYRSTCYSRHTRAVQELQREGWRLTETKSNKQPTIFQLAPPPGAKDA